MLSKKLSHLIVVVDVDEPSTLLVVVVEEPSFLPQTVIFVAKAFWIDAKAKTNNSNFFIMQKLIIAYSLLYRLYEAGFSVSPDSSTLHSRELQKVKKHYKYPPPHCLNLAVAKKSFIFFRRPEWWAVFRCLPWCKYRVSPVLYNSRCRHPGHKQSGSLVL